jgi:hypothetical protein
VRTRNAAEVKDLHEIVADRGLDLLDQPVWDLRELRAQAELIEQGQCGGMDGVAAEVAQEVAVFLQHGDRDDGPGQ